ncbi:hypothetical protein F4677DRAFT_310640 [Hypoxylon crocopeplum]|nr:hypothetical protein F4677DRAFT_310640 [Hypoxylon crocopeplum]
MYLMRNHFAPSTIQVITYTPECSLGTDVQTELHHLLLAVPPLSCFFGRLLVRCWQLVSFGSTYDTNHAGHANLSDTCVLLIAALPTYLHANTFGQAAYERTRSPHSVDLSVDDEQESQGVEYPLLKAGESFGCFHFPRLDSDIACQQPHSTNERPWAPPICSCELGCQRLPNLCGRKKEGVFILIPPTNKSPGIPAILIR